jgi:acyl-CoA thioesterase-1
VNRFLAFSALLATIACGSDEAASRARTEDRPASISSSSSLANAPAPRAADRDAADAPRIVVLGDSLTAGLGLAPHEAYPALLQQRLRQQGFDYRVVNAGISGDTSAGGLSRLDLALEGDVRILVVALGGNDALRGLPVTQLRDNLARIIERALARDVSVVLAGMEAPPNWGAQYTSAFRTVYRSLAEEYGVALVPFLLEGVAGVEHLNQRDGIHPTAEGDRVIAETVWSVLRPIVEQLAAQGEGASGS